jgi:hypothetical protein
MTVCCDCGVMLELEQMVAVEVVPRSEADALAETLERLRRYLAPLDDGSHQRLGEACGLDACVICLSEGLIAETLTEFRSRHPKETP